MDSTNAFETCRECGGPIYPSLATGAWVHEGRDDDHEASPVEEG